MAVVRSMALVLLNTQEPNVIPHNLFSHSRLFTGVFSCLQEALYQVMSEV